MACTIEITIHVNESKLMHALLAARCFWPGNIRVFQPTCVVKLYLQMGLFIRFVVWM